MFCSCFSWHNEYNFVKRPAGNRCDPQIILSKPVVCFKQNHGDVKKSRLKTHDRLFRFFQGASFSNALKLHSTINANNRDE